MIRKIFLVVLFAGFGLSLTAQEIHYRLKMEEPHKHYFQVEMEVSNWKGKNLDVKLPVWAPGSYLVREFARHVDFFDATSEGKKLNWKKTDKNTWSIQTNGARKILIGYKVYAYELSVRTSFLDDSHGYVNGTTVFMYIPGKKNLPGTLEIIPWSGFKKVSTGLDPKSGKTFHYTFPDYDFLVDCPIEIGNQQTFSFMASGIQHEVAMYGEGNYDIDQLKKDMATVVEQCTAVFGENPNKNYVFIIHNLTLGTGGLEHLNSTTLQVNRWSYKGSGYNGFLSLVAHEYFHLWNVKRLRADVLGPFNYDAENYTTLLWVQEGFTSYYDELLLRRAGFHTRKDYLGILSGMINAVENTPGSKVQSAAESSFDAWIKGYRPNENSVNTQISYYTKGQLLGALLDMEILIATKGEKDLDDLMKYLYDEYYKKLKRGMTEAEFKTGAEKIAGINLDSFFENYVFGTKSNDYDRYFNAFGLSLKRTDRKNEVSLGAKLSESGGKLIVKEVTAGGSAYEGGLNVNDEIIACNGYRVDQSSLNRFVNDSAIGDTLSILVSRDNVLKTIKVKLLPNSVVSHQVTVSDQTDVNQEKLLKRWLGE